MLYNVTEIHGDRDHVARRYEATAFEDDNQPYRVAGPVLLAFDVTRSDRRVHVVGGVKTTLELSCGRCAELFRLPVDAEFDLRYLPRAENTGEGEVEIEEDDLTTAYYEEHAIDLRQLVTEQFYLTLPMKPLCADECRGLCTQCGTNLNVGSCACESKRSDPRLAALESLLERGDPSPAERKDGE